MSFSTQDTIVAIATPPGRGGLGIVRLSGPDAHPFALALITHGEPLSPRYATFTKVALPAIHATPDGGVQSRSQVDETIDHVVVTYFPAPASYTGEHVVELSAHGSPVVLRAIVSAAIERGARLAEPGEFTLRAFLNGRIDLLQAEAVNDLIEAVTPLQARVAFDQLDGTLTRAIASIDETLFDLIARLEASVDFPEEGYHFVDPGALASAIDGLLERTAALLADARRGRMIRDGLRVAIVGEPNAGKSSLFNALAGAPRAIVSDVPGTTRDLVTEVVDIEGLRVTLVDTAGLRDTSDLVEVEGVARAQQSMAAADLVLMVEDRSRLRSGKAADVRKVLCIANKIDLPAAWNDETAVSVSATTGDGIQELRRRIAGALDADAQRDQPAMTNVRHIALLDSAFQALQRARGAALTDGGSLSEEFVLADLAEARGAFEEVSGRRAPDDVLTHIFSRFCVGK
jgi:tRNA modification GTPase